MNLLFTWLTFLVPISFIFAVWNPSLEKPRAVLRDAINRYETSGLNKAFRRMLTVTHGWLIPKKPEWFLFLAGVVGTFTYAAVDQLTADTRSSCVIGTASALIYLVSPLYKLREIRRQTSYDLADLIARIYARYQINKDMTQALEDTMHATTNRDLQQRLAAIIKARRTSGLETAIQDFVWTVDTLFSRQFGATLRRSLLKNESVTHSLESLQRAIDNNRRALEHDRTTIGLATGYLVSVVLSVIGVNVGMINLIGSFSKWQSLQFADTDRAVWIATICSVLVCILALQWFKGAKNDF